MTGDSVKKAGPMGRGDAIEKLIGVGIIVVGVFVVEK